MGFLFPLFLLAGLALAIPVLIHLFNLRKFKRIPFPDTRFLRNIQLSTKRQSRIRNWRLLLLRMLFLAALVVAFAQPYTGNRSKEEQPTVVVVCIDNSYSMTVGEGQESLLQKVKARAKDLISNSGTEARFLVLSNDRHAGSRPLSRKEALAALSGIQPVSRSSSLRQIMNSIQAAGNNEKRERWAIYLFSDLQKNTFLPQTGDPVPLPGQSRLYIYPARAAAAGNIYVDTAYFISPVLDTRQPNDLVVVLRQSGKATARTTALSISVGNQVRAVSTATLQPDTLWRDTFALQLNEPGWQHMAIAVEDHPLSFDDTFRIAARTRPQLSVLIVSDQGPVPYLQTAFTTQEGFRVKQQPIGAVRKEEWPGYNLIILQNISVLTPPLEVAVKEALQRGQNVLLFPGKVVQTEAFNQALQTWGAITLGREDTSRQQVVSLQQMHPLFNDLFEKVQESMQLPVTARRYPIDAAINANQQALMSFRDGRPFLAEYSLFKGKLYLCATSIDDYSSNFALSYYFAPVLYKMAMQGGGSNIYALPVGSQQPVWLPAEGMDERKVWHLKGEGLDVIPEQRPSGSGMEIFAGNVVEKAGFYYLDHESATDSTWIALNANRAESELSYATKDEVTGAVKPSEIQWLDDQQVQQQGWGRAANPFPLWKVCVLIALIALAGETWLLVKKKAKMKE